MVKRTYCDGDFCGYNSGDEKTIMNEYDAGTSMTASAASTMAQKVARDSRKGASKMKEDSQANERNQLAKLGIVPEAADSSDNTMLDNVLDEVGKSNAYRRAANERLLANYVIQHRSYAGAREDMKSELTMESTWSPALRHWWRRLGKNLGVGVSNKVKALLILSPKKNAIYAPGDRFDIKWACHGDIARVNVELHRDVAMGSRRKRSLVIASHRPMQCGMGVARGNVLWRVPKDYDRTNEERKRKNKMSISAMQQNADLDDDLELEERKKRHGAWRIVISAASGVEKNVVYAVSDVFHLFPTGSSGSKKNEIKRRRLGIEDDHNRLEHDNDHDNGNDNETAEDNFENEDFQIDQWEQQLLRRNINGAHVDNMRGRVMGVSNEDDLEKPGAMDEFYKEVNACSCCYKVYRTLDKRREKMREAARARRKVFKNNVVLEDIDYDGGVRGDDQIHGRGLKQEEIWAALGYGRVKNKNEDNEERVKRQKARVEKLSAVPKHRDLREIIKERKKQETRDFNKKLLQERKDSGLVEEYKKKPKLSNVKKIVQRIEQRANEIDKYTTQDKEKMFVGEQKGFVANIDRKARVEMKKLEQVQKELKEDQDAIDRGEYDVLGGKSWQEAVLDFQVEGAKNPYKVKIAVKEPMAKRVARTLDKVGGGGGGGGGLY